MAENGGDYKTFVGTGFGTLMIQFAGGTKETPKVASERAYLRSGLPGLYQEEDFGMRFVGALEEILDPVVGVLDALPAHFDPAFAPRDILSLLSSWLGVDIDESQPIQTRRDKVSHAAELGRSRGTLHGMELALKLTFPKLPLRVEDLAGVTWSTDVTTQPQDNPSSFVVYCDKPIPEDQQAAVARCIEQVKPVHTTYRLRVKAPKKKPDQT